MRKLFLVGCVFALLLSAGGASAEELTVEIDRLPESAASSFLLRDIARFSGPADVVSLAGDARVKVRRRYLWRSDVVAALVDRGVGGVTLRLLMPPKIAAGKGESLPELESLVKRLSGWDGIVRARGAVTLPAGDLVSPKAIRPGASSVTFRIGTNDGVREIPVSLEWLQRIVVTRRIIESGVVLAADDLEVKQVQITTPLNALSDVSQAVGRMTGRRLGEGERVSGSFLSAVPVVRRGDSVSIVVRKGTLSLRIPGEVLEDGAVGDKVRVRNVQSKRILEASVVSGEEVEVRIP